MTIRGTTAKLSVIKQIELEAAHVPGAVSLAQGIPSFDTPEPIKRRVIDAIERGVVARYSLTNGMSELREAIEDHLYQQGMSYDYDAEIIVTVGSIEGITATLLATVGEGDQVLIPTPSYVSYADAVRLAGAEPVFVPLSEDDGWSVSIPTFIAACTSKTRAIILCNPNNPTGTLFRKDQLLELADYASANDILLLLDEVYRDFLYDEDDRQAYFSLAMEPRYRKTVVRVFSFSKVFAMTGWRVGYLHTDRSLAQRILRIHDNLVTCAPVVSQYAALAALDMKPAEWVVYRDEYQARRDLMCQQLAALEPWLSFIRPNSAYFVFPKLRTEKLHGYTQSMDFALHLLREEKVAVVPGSAFGPTGEHHLRLSFGRDRDEIRTGLERLTQHFRAHA